MKETGSVWVLVLVGVVLALVVSAGLGTWLIGAETLRVMGLVLVSGLVLCGVLVAVAVVVRAYRRNDAQPIERQVIRETRIIDSRPPAPYQLPAPQATPFGVFPELLRAAYRSGALSSGSDVVDAEVRSLPAPGEWGGDITP